MACPTNEQVLRDLYVDETLARVRAEAELANLPAWVRELAKHGSPDDVLIEIVDRAVNREIAGWKVSAPHRVGAERLQQSIKLALRAYFVEVSDDDA